MREEKLLLGRLQEEGESEKWEGASYWGSGCDLSWVHWPFLLNQI